MVWFIVSLWSKFGQSNFFFKFAAFFVSLLVISFKFFCIWTICHIDSDFLVDFCLIAFFILGRNFLQGEKFVTKKLFWQYKYRNMLFSLFGFSPFFSISLNSIVWVGNLPDFYLVKKSTLIIFLVKANVNFQNIQWKKRSNARDIYPELIFGNERCNYQLDSVVFLCYDS